MYKPNLKKFFSGGDYLIVLLNGSLCGRIWGSKRSKFTLGKFRFFGPLTFVMRKTSRLCGAESGCFVTFFCIV